MPSGNVPGWKGSSIYALGQASLDITTPYDVSSVRQDPALKRPKAPNITLEVRCPFLLSYKAALAHFGAFEGWEALGFGWDRILARIITMC